MQTQPIKSTRQSRQTIDDVPALKKIPLSVNIRRITCDSNGTIIDDAAVPLSQRKPFPFHLFGQYDFAGGFANADARMAGVYNTILFGVYVWGIGTPLFFFSGLNTINRQIRKGDLVFIYVDDIDNPNVFSFVICSTQQGGYASLVSQTNVTQLDRNSWGVFKIFDVQYKWFNDAQLNDGLWLINSRFDSSVQSNPINPNEYYNPYIESEIKSINIPLELLANQYLGLSSFIAFENSLLTLTFNLYE